MGLRYPTMQSCPKEWRVTGSGMYHAAGREGIFAMRRPTGTMFSRWVTNSIVALLLSALSPAMAAAAAFDAHTDVRHIVPPFNPELDAVQAPASFGTGRIWHVGPTRDYKKPSDVVRLVDDGDIVEIDAAIYKCDESVQWRANDLTLVGVGGRPVLDATGCSIRGGKGIWDPVGRNLIVDNISFVGAKVSSQNGAGIRYEGTGYLYVTRSYFGDNEDGILYTPNQAYLDTNNIVIDRSEFDHNGFSTGQAHNMYIAVCKSFVLRFSYSHDAVIGHEVKSRSRTNLILYNRIAGEGGGTASYDVELPQGGLTYIIGNIIQKSPNADNPSSISYAVEPHPHPIQKLYVAYNPIVNQSSRTQYRRALFIDDKGLSEAKLVDNLIIGINPSTLMIGSGAGKVQVAGNVITDQPGFYDAGERLYQLAAHSPAIDRAIPAGVGDGFSLTPKYEFVFPDGDKPRPVVGKPDVGAYEFDPGERIPPAPVIHLRAVANPVDYNAPVRLTWSADDATRCSASGGWWGEQPVAGEYVSRPLTQRTTFTLRCSGPSGSRRAAIAVSVNDSPRAAALGVYRWKRIGDSALVSLCPSRLAYPDLYGSTGCEAKQAFATGVYVPDAQKWYLLGGGGTNGYYGNEVYAFSLRTLRPERFTEPMHISGAREYAPGDHESRLRLSACDGILHLNSGGTAPAPRGIAGQAMYDPRTRKIIVGPWGFVLGIGKCDGSALGRFATDQWSFDPFTGQWALLAPADDRFGSTIPSTWFLDSTTGIAYNADGSRSGATRGAWLIDYGTSPPHAELVDAKWPYASSMGPVAIDSTHHDALQLIQQSEGLPPSVAVYDLYQLMGLYNPAAVREASDTSYRPDTSWTVTGDTSILAAAHPALTFNPRLDMFVAWNGGDEVYFLRPDYRARKLDIISKRVAGGPSPQGEYALNGLFTYLPDHDAYLVFTGMKQDFQLLLPPGSPVQ